MAGLEVESVERAGAAVRRRRRGGDARASSRIRRPTSLSVCTVDDGRGELLQIVCGAPNVRAGMKAPFARGRRHAARRQGHQRPPSCAASMSHGMLCSAQGARARRRRGRPAAARRRCAGRHDRARLSAARRRDPRGQRHAESRRLLQRARHRARARRARAVRCSRTARRSPRRRRRSNDRLPVELLGARELARVSPAACVRGIDSGAKSPLWLRERLRRAGLRAISPVVDVTNYVMLELGQPLHAYDLDKLERRHRRALRDEPARSSTLLDGKDIELTRRRARDRRRRGPVGLAGIMGGQSTAVERGDHVDLPRGARSSRRRAIAGERAAMACITDASQRFERGVDPTRPGARASSARPSCCSRSAGGAARAR